MIVALWAVVLEEAQLGPGLASRLGDLVVLRLQTAGLGQPRTLALRQCGELVRGRDWLMRCHTRGRFSEVGGVSYGHGRWSTTVAEVAPGMIGAHPTRHG